MITIGTAASVNVRAASKPRGRVELLSPGSALDMDTPPRSHTRFMNSRGRVQPQSCHSGKVAHAGPMQSRFNSAFAAQILGQEPVTKNRDPEQAQRAYAQACAQDPAPQLLRLA